MKNPTQMQTNPLNVAEFIAELKAFYLRRDGRSFSSSYHIAIRLAEQNGWATLSESAARRRINAEVPYRAQLLARSNGGGK